MGTILAWLLPLFGPALFRVKPFVPSLAGVKSVLIGAVVIAVLGAGGYAGWTIHSWGEAGRTAKASKEAVVRASLVAQAETLRGAVAQQTATLEDRDRSLAESEAKNSELNKTLEALRAQSAEAYDAAAPVLMSDDPWLRDRPAAGHSRMGRRDGGGTRGMPPVRSSRPRGS